jgi:hypothetical protein
VVGAGVGETAALLALAVTVTVAGAPAWLVLPHATIKAVALTRTATPAGAAQAGVFTLVAPVVGGMQVTG